jgi:hypothetical protein
MRAVRTGPVRRGYLVVLIVLVCGTVPVDRALSSESVEGKVRIVKDPETLTYQCIYTLVRDVEQPLRAALGEPRDRKVEYIACDERTNTLFMKGPPDRIALARKLVKKIDEGQRWREGRRSGPPLKVYPVPGGNAELIAKRIQEDYKNAPNVRVRALRADAIAVYGELDGQLDVAIRIIRFSGWSTSTETAEPVMKAYRLENYAEAAAKPLREVFKDAPDVCVIVCDRDTLLVYASPDNLVAFDRLLPGPP